MTFIPTLVQVDLLHFLLTLFHHLCLHQFFPNLINHHLPFLPKPIPDHLKLHLLTIFHLLFPS